MSSQNYWPPHPRLLRHLLTTPEQIKLLCHILFKINSNGLLYLKLRVLSPTMSMLCLDYGTVLLNRRITEEKPIKSYYVFYHYISGNENICLVDIFLFKYLWNCLNFLIVKEHAVLWFSIWCSKLVSRKQSITSMLIRSDSVITNSVIMNTRLNEQKQVSW